jgi:hypothetical protein
MSSRLRQSLDLISLNAILLLVASGIASLDRSMYLNSLELHESWVSSKDSIQMGLMGAVEFGDRWQAVAGNRLNLAAWYGFHELRNRSAAVISELEVEAGFEPDGYVNLLYDIREDGFSGVRISNRTDLPSVQFRASPDGEFLSVRALTVSERLKFSSMAALQASSSGPTGRSVSGFAEACAPPGSTTLCFALPAARRFVKASAIHAASFGERSRYLAWGSLGSD